MRNKILAGGLLCVAAALMAGCSDEMNYYEYNKNNNYDYVTRNFDNVNRFVTRLYAEIGDDKGNYGGAFLGSATDESEYATPGTSIETFYNGGWSPASPQSSTWTGMYAAISDANVYLARFAYGLTFPELELDMNYDQKMYRYHKAPFEVRWLRAWYYFNLVRQYKDVPFYTDDLSAEDINKLSRTASNDIFDFIIKECDAIKDSIPVNWETDRNMPEAEPGRINRPQVLALKARAALYKASPLFNADNKDLWKAAALANKAVIDSCLQWGYSLQNVPYTQNWAKDNHMMVSKKTEVIMVYRQGQINTLESRNFPFGVEGGNGGNCPTQTLVDAYEVKENGTSRAFDWNNPNDAANPCATANRDPRFGMTVAVNGDKKWPTYNTTALETFYGGTNGEPLAGATPTGYYLKKLLNGSTDLRPGKGSKYVHNEVIFRLAEFYLNYAEAVFKYLGSADATSAEFPMSARDAVNVVRSRVGVNMPPLPAGLSKDNFWKRYENERFVELAFEGHRFWDLRRWKEGKKLENIKELKITKNNDGTFTYTPQVKKRMTWDDKMYLFPIPLSEIQKNPNLKQNPGW